MYRKIMFLMAASVILVPSIHAFSLRLNVPVSGSYEVEGCSECSPKSGGYSIRGIFGMFGLGYAVGTFDYGYPSTSESTDLKLAANAVDLSASFSFLTVGVGSVISGTLEGKFAYTRTDGIYTFVGDTKYALDGSMTGTTSFINFDFGIGPIDLLVGYRMWNTKFKPKYSGTQVNTFTLLGTNYYHSTSSVDESQSETSLDFNQITAGIGFGF